MLLKSVLLVFVLFREASGVSFEVTNLVCQIKDPSALMIHKCIYKAVNRTYKYVSIHASLLRKLTDVKVSCAILKRANGYKPFLFNKTVDICEFMRYKKRFPVLEFIYSLVAEYTNVNHTCPFKHDLILEKLDIFSKTKQVLSVLPMPHGEFAVYAALLENDVQLATLRGYGRLY